MKIIVVWVMAVVSVIQVVAVESDTVFIQQLFNKTARPHIARGGYTQTSAHLSIPQVQQKIKSELSGFGTHAQIINQALMRETEYKRQYDVFYTLQACSQLLQDVARELYKRRVGTVGALKNDAFQFVRYEYQKSYNQFSDVNAFLKQAIKKDGITFDLFDHNKLLVAFRSFSLLTMRARVFTQPGCVLIARYWNVIKLWFVNRSHRYWHPMDIPICTWINCLSCRHILLINQVRHWLICYKFLCQRLWWMLLVMYHGVWPFPMIRN